MVRHAKPSEAEQIADVTASAFGYDREDGRWAWTRDTAAAQPDRYIVNVKAGEIVGCLLVTPFSLWISEAVIRLADVGHVAVRQDLQGQGLGSKLMDGAVKLLRADGYHLSRLGGMVRFYSRFGYRPFPRGMYEIIVEPLEFGMSAITAEEAHRLPPDMAGRVRRYHPARDWAACMKLWEEMYRCRTGAVVREINYAVPPTAGPDPQGLCFVYDDRGVRGYVFAHRNPEGRVFRPCEARILVSEAAYKQDRPEALWAPMRALAAEAARLNCPRILARLPFDARVEEALLEGGLTFRRCELMGGTAGNMICLLNLPGLLQAILPELQRRVSQAGFRARVVLQVMVERQQATLKLNHGRVHVLPCGAGLNGASYETLRMTTFAFTALLLGLRDWEQVSATASHNLSAAGHAAVKALFPPQPAATGHWG
ncbi:MAG: GNAT family N-acetyltransferase [Armatimonadetes bacterium]|nr:GNAT family N-acetyltransferase [Armatimonadota bacterium]